MALSLVLKLKEQKRILPRGLVLMSPWTDLTSSGRTHKTKAELDPVLDAEYLERMIRNYIPGYRKQGEDAKAEETALSELSEKEEQMLEAPSALEAPPDLKNPLISPLFGDFSGFPPTYIQVGENEILLSDSLMLHKKLVQENISVKLDILRGCGMCSRCHP